MPIITITDGIPRQPQYRMATPVNFTLNQGETLAIVGDNASGKTMLIDILTGAHPLMPTNPVRYDFTPSTAPLVSDNIRHITFRDTYGTATDATYYHQQRWNQHDVTLSPTVAQQLQESLQQAHTALTRRTVYDRFVVRDTPTDTPTEAEAQQRRQLHDHLLALRDRLYDTLNLRPLLDKHLVMLSSGEMRKFQLTRILLTNPRLLIIDNPFIGLDVAARQQLQDLLTHLTTQTQTTLILVVSRPDDIPPCVTHVVPVAHMEVMPKQTRQEYLTQHTAPNHSPLTPEHRQAILLQHPTTPHHSTSDPVVQFRNVTIRYGQRTILHNLNLTVRQGEHWALTGDNGAGKSTLLSIVCADNPQAYANDIILFGHQRGHGESIWDIKRHIGYVSPEMHRSYLRDLPVLRIVASGMSDMQGHYLTPRHEHQAQTHFWLSVFGIDHLADTSFLRLSSGEQRLVLLARAFVRNPSLLILDEPLHGLDPTRRALVLDIIQTYASQPRNTLIMVTHYPEELPPCIDHRIHLKRLG